MSTVMDPKLKKRRAFVRAGLCVVYVVFSAFIFVTGKGHTIIIDNKDSDDGTVKAVESLTVSVDGQEPIDLSAGDRDMAKVRGQGHQVEITIQGQTSKTRIKVPLKEDVLLLSLPKLLAGQPAVTKFVPVDAAPVTSDQGGQSSSFTSPSTAAPSGAPDAAAAPAAPAAPASPAAPVAP